MKNWWNKWSVVALLNHHTHTNWVYITSGHHTNLSVLHLRTFKKVTLAANTLTMHFHLLFLLGKFHINILHYSERDGNIKIWRMSRNIRLSSLPFMVHSMYALKALANSTFLFLLLNKVNWKQYIIKYGVWYAGFCCTIFLDSYNSGFHQQSRSVAGKL